MFEREREKPSVVATVAVAIVLSDVADAAAAPDA